MSYALYITVDGVRYRGNSVRLQPIRPGSHAVVITSGIYDGEYHLTGYHDASYTLDVPTCGGKDWGAA